VRRRFVSDAVIPDREDDPGMAIGQHDLDLGRLGVLGYIGQALLKDTVENDFDLLVQPLLQAKGLKFNPDVRPPHIELVNKPFQGGYQSQMIQQVGGGMMWFSSHCPQAFQPFGEDRCIAASVP